MSPEDFIKNSSDDDDAVTRLYLARGSAYRLRQSIGQDKETSREQLIILLARQTEELGRRTLRKNQEGVEWAAGQLMDSLVRFVELYGVGGKQADESVAVPAGFGAKWVTDLVYKGKYHLSWYPEPYRMWLLIGSAISLVLGGASTHVANFPVWMSWTLTVAGLAQLAVASGLSWYASWIEKRARKIREGEDPYFSVGEHDRPIAPDLRLIYQEITTSGDAYHATTTLSGTNVGGMDIEPLLPLLQDPPDTVYLREKLGIVDDTDA